MKTIVTDAFLKRLFHFWRSEKHHFGLPPLKKISLRNYNILPSYTLCLSSEVCFILWQHSQTSSRIDKSDKVGLTCFGTLFSGVVIFVQRIRSKPWTYKSKFCESFSLFFIPYPICLSKRPSLYLLDSLLQEGSHHASCIMQWKMTFHGR